MTYDECLKKINSKLKFGIKPGLDRIKKVLNEIGNPQDNLKFIHVAGTNGKGSTCNMIASVLKESGYKTGLFTSPFIINFRDRIKVNDQMISEDELCKIVKKLNPYADSLTEFEFITIIAFEWFSNKNCDVVVLETGLGGRLDATNVINTPLVSVITSISFDHTAILGESLEKITLEKCGIIKRNGITVSYPVQSFSVIEVIKQEAKQKNNILIIPKFSDVKLVNRDTVSSHFYYKGNDMTLNLAGEHQVKNCMVAIETLEALKKHHDFDIPNLSIARGIKKVNMPARIQTILTKPTIILDGSHNPDGAEALSRFIDEFFLEKNLIGIVGMLKDKDYNCMLKKLIPKFKKVYTVPVDSPRSLSASDLKLAVQRYCQNTYEKKSIEEAINYAMESCFANNLIIIFGSLYLSERVINFVKFSLGRHEILH